MFLRFLTATLAGIVLATATASAAAPKKLLVVSITTGFRHSSIETGEKVIQKLADESGAFTVDFVRQPEAAPKQPGKPKREEKDTDETFKAKEDAYAKAMTEYLPARKAWEDKVQTYAKEHLGAEKLKQYDGFIFCNTTGELPFPDAPGFIEMIRGGKAFIAMHSASDTYHRFRPYVDMLGGEFQSHKEQVEVEPIIHDAAHPATKPIPQGFKVFDEIYLMQSYEKSQVHGLLGLNKHPNFKETDKTTDEEREKAKGYFPISWNKEFGSGRVFYTSLGHREDVWDDQWKDGGGNRKNSPEIAKTFQAHILGGIKWALKLEDGDASLGNVK